MGQVRGSTTEAHIVKKQEQKENWHLSMVSGLFTLWRCLWAPFVLCTKPNPAPHKVMLRWLSHIKRVRGKWGIFSGAPGFCRKTESKKKTILKVLLDFTSMKFLSVSGKKLEMSKCMSPWTRSKHLHTLGNFVPDFIYRNNAQLLRGLISHPKDDEANDSRWDGGSLQQTHDKDSEHCAALPSLLQPARPAHTTAELLWGRPAPGREKIKKEMWTDHPKLMMEKSENTCKRNFHYARIIINHLQLPVTKCC